MIDSEQIDIIAGKVRPLLAGQPPELVGCVIADLLATLIAGHHPDIREQAFDAIIDLVVDLVPVEIERMVEAGRCPPEWRGKPQ